MKSVVSIYCNKKVVVCCVLPSLTIRKCGRRGESCVIVKVDV